MTEGFSRLQAIVRATFHKFCLLNCSVLLLSLTVSALELPAGIALEARLPGLRVPQRRSDRGHDYRSGQR